MNEAVEIFKPGIAELKEIATKYEGLTINGVADEEGYKAVKAARKELGDIRILITKSGKKFREEALEKQRQVIREEKEYLEVITPTENALKAKIEAVDAEKARTERMILLPSRKLMLEEISLEMTDDEILNLDEKEFSAMYTSKKMEYLEEQDRKRKEEERQKQHEEEVKRASEEAAKRATEEAERKAKEDIYRAERDKKEAIEKMKREQEQAEAKRIKDAEDKLAAEKADIERAEKNRRYKKWVSGLSFAEIGFDMESGDKIERIGDTFVAYKKIGEITIK